MKHARIRRMVAKNAKFLREIREASGLGPTQFALQHGLYPQSWANYERGCDRRISTLMLLKQKLGLNWAQIERWLSEEFGND